MLVRSGFEGRLRGVPLMERMGQLVESVVTLVPVIGALAAAAAAAMLARPPGPPVRGESNPRLDAAVAASLVLIGVLTLVPVPVEDPSRWVRWNIVPFGDFAASLVRGPMAIAVESANLLANVALFFPFGVVAALREPRLDIRRFTAAATLLSLAVELAQFAEGMGREADVTDVITNAAGAALGFAAARGFVGKRPTG